jgi:hypothetical protein
LAAVNTAGSLLTWNPSANNIIYSLGIDSDSLLAQAFYESFSMPVFTRLSDNKIVNLRKG